MTREIETTCSCGKPIYKDEAALTVAFFIVQYNYSGNMITLLGTLITT